MLASFNFDNGRMTSMTASSFETAMPQVAPREPKLAELCFMEANGDPLLALDIACADRLDLFRANP